MADRSRRRISSLAIKNAGKDLPEIITTEELAKLVRRRPKTIYFWIAEGRLDGAYKKRGKHHLILRDQAMEIILNGPEWRNEREG